MRVGADYVEVIGVDHADYFDDAVIRKRRLIGQARHDELAVDLARFRLAVNEAFVRAVGAEVVPCKGSRRVIGRDGLARLRQKAYAVVDVTSEPSWPDAEQLGQMFAQEVRAHCPAATAIAYVGDGPVLWPGEGHVGHAVRVITDADGNDHLQARMAIYYAPLDGDAPGIRLDEETL